MALYDKRNTLAFYILFYFLNSLVNCIELRNDLEKETKIFKIIERGNKVILQKAENQNFDEKYLKDFLKNNADLEYRIKNILNTNVNYSNGLKKKFIKRAVPHGVETPDIQYNNKDNSFFKPLIRVHKTKKLETSDDISIQDKLPRYNVKGRKAESKYNQHSSRLLNAIKNRLMDQIDGIKEKPVRSDETSYSNNGYQYEFSALQNSDKRFPFSLSFKQSDVQQAIKYLLNIDTLIDRSTSLKQKAELNRKLRIAISYIKELHKDLLATLKLDDVRSGAPFVEETIPEEEPPTFTVAPGSNVTMNFNMPVEKISVKPIAMYPHEPLWNYWTYKNNIQLDDCPDDQVKIGNVCSRKPPHKK